MTAPSPSSGSGSPSTLRVVCARPRARLRHEAWRPSEGMSDIGRPMSYTIGSVSSTAPLPSDDGRPVLDRAAPLIGRRGAWRAWRARCARRPRSVWGAWRCDRDKDASAEGRDRLVEGIAWIADCCGGGRRWAGGAGRTTVARRAWRVRVRGRVRATVGGGMSVRGSAACRQLHAPRRHADRGARRRAERPEAFVRARIRDDRRFRRRRA